MELSEKEKLLIEAVREMDEPPANILLWYGYGIGKALEDTIKIHGRDVRGDSRRVKIANEYSRKMNNIKI